MHHAPPRVPLTVRVAALLARVRFRAAAVLAPLGTVIVVLRHTRLLTLSLAALVLGALALAAPLAPYDGGARSTAALSSPSGSEQQLLPATGNGWTQDGAPAVESPSGSDERAPSPEGSSSRGSSASSSSAAVDQAGEAPPASDSGSESSPESSSASPESSESSESSERSPSRKPSSSPSPSARERAESPSDAPTAPPEAETPAADPTDAVLAAVNAARTTAGCPALTADAGLASLAAEHSAAARDGGSAPDDDDHTTAVATGTDPAAVADGLLADDDLLDCDLSTAGVGATDGFWTLLAA